MKILLLMLVLAIGVSGQVVKTSYDRFKDETTISTTFSQSSMDMNYNSYSWTIETSFTGKGDAPAEPMIVLSLLVSGKNWKLLRSDLTLRAIVDDERITIGEMKRVYSEVLRGATLEVARLIISVDIVKKLASAKNVEVSIGGSEMVLQPHEREKLKLFLAAIRP